MKNGRNAVLWWIGWICLTILSFFVSAYFWTRVIAERFGSMHEAGIPILWVVAVFGTWMVLLVPLIVVMYAKVDKAYEDARLAREESSRQKARAQFNLRSVWIDEKERALDPALIKKIRKIPRAIPRGHLVTAVLRDGRKIDHVFVLDGREVVGVYDAETVDFKIRDIVDVAAADLDHLPPFDEERWLRLDGLGA